MSPSDNNCEIRMKVESTISNNCHRYQLLIGDLVIETGYRETLAEASDCARNGLIEILRSDDCFTDIVNCGGRGGRWAL